LIGDLGDAIQHDPEVQQARRIADAARARLVTSMTGPQDVIDPAEAQRMLDAFRNARAHAEEAEDQVLVHRGVLTAAEAGRRATLRRPVASGVVAARPAGSRPLGSPLLGSPLLGSRAGGRAGHPNGLRVIAGLLAVAAAGIVYLTLARWLGVRPPLARW
jgi:hypothetical protein